MIILGLDPGLATTGYGIIRVEGSKLSLIDYGVFATTPDTAFSKRLLHISTMLSSLFDTHAIDEVAIEDLFFSTNKKTAMLVAQARGVLVVTTEQSSIPIYSYKPNEIKLAVSGYGGADKLQVQCMVQRLLHLDHKPKPDDAADGLAIAICHMNSRHIKHYESRLNIVNNKK
mgnify:CR=1 FL=1